MRKNLSKMNFGLLILMILFSAFGLIMIFSASHATAVERYKMSANHYFIFQAFFLLIGYVAGIIILLIPTKFYSKKICKILLLGGSIGSLLLLKLYGIAAGGAQSWFNLGIVRLQPTEIIKIAMIIYLAVAYNKVHKKRKVNIWDLVIPLIPVLICAIIIATQPDFGGAAILIFIAILIVLALPAAKKYRKVFIIVGICGVLSGVLLIIALKGNIIQEYQLDRLLNFQKPCERYTEDSGYQVCNGYIAIKNGGLTGVGLDKSTQKLMYLPEAHTDFIFPIICEELGLIVGLIIVLLYFIILYIILNIAKESENLRNSIIAYGVFAYLTAHILINLLGVLGLIPLTGVPLPFLSYGGSYNISVLIALFLVQRVNIENKVDKARRKIKEL